MRIKLNQKGLRNTITGKIALWPILNELIIESTQVLVLLIFGRSGSARESFADIELFACYDRNTKYNKNNICKIFIIIILYTIYKAYDRCQQK